MFRESDSRCSKIHTMGVAIRHYCRCHVISARYSTYLVILHYTSLISAYITLIIERAKWLYQVTGLTITSSTYLTLYWLTPNKLATYHGSLCMRIFLVNHIMQFIQSSHECSATTRGGTSAKH